MVNRAEESRTEQKGAEFQNYLQVYYPARVTHESAGVCCKLAIRP
jgi:hypothetical protein